MGDRYWDGGKLRRQPRSGSRSSGARWLLWLERVVLGAALLVWMYGMWIAVTSDLDRGAALAIPAALVLLVGAWRRGVFEIPPPA